MTGCCVGALITLIGIGGCETTYTTRVSGVQAGNGGNSADLVMFAYSPADGDQSWERMAMQRDSSRRDVALGVTSDEGYAPLGWWEERGAPQVDRPYYVRTSRNADQWNLPMRPDVRRRDSYWAR